MSRKALRALTIALVVAFAGLAVTPVIRAGWRQPTIETEDTVASRARRRAEIRLVVAGCVVLAVGLATWGRDLAAMLRRRRAASLAPVPPWHESGPAGAVPAGAGWDYHPPPDKEQPSEEPPDDPERTRKLRRQR